MLVPEKSNIISWLESLGYPKGPKCDICGTEFAPYDMVICKKCQEAIDRLSFK